jgi:hypothetical protein
VIYRRQRKQYLFAGFLAVLALVNVLFFFILNRPARTEYASLEESIKQLRLKSALDKRTFTNLQKISDNLKSFDKDKKTLQMTRLVHRPLGYSQIVTTLDELVQRSGLKKTHVAYNQDLTPHAGLNAVSMTLPLEGSYSNIVSFIRELENSETFFLITGISLQSSGQVAAQPSNVISASNSGGTGTVALALAIETYFYQ